MAVKKSVLALAALLLVTIGACASPNRKIASAPGPEGGDIGNRGMEVNLKGVHKIYCTSGETEFQGTFYGNGYRPSTIRFAEYLRLTMVKGEVLGLFADKSTTFDMGGGYWKMELDESGSNFSASRMALYSYSTPPSLAAEKTTFDLNSSGEFTLTRGQNNPPEKLQGTCRLD